MRDYIYHVIGMLYRIVKMILKKNPYNKVTFIWLYDTNEKEVIINNNEGSKLNDMSICDNGILQPGKIYYGDNYLIGCNFAKYHLPILETNKMYCSNAYDAWLYAMNNAIVPDGYKNSGLAKVAFILDSSQYCLSSWIWTSGKILQHYVENGELDKAKKLANEIIKRQDSSGGWIVRNDILDNNIIPVLAQNDSAYLANKGLLSLFEIIRDPIYLDASEKCAKWIMCTTRDDGLVPTGIDAKTGKALDDRIIVDTGFTAGLFAKLYLLTKNEVYKSYAINFCMNFIKYFFDQEKKCFATNIDARYVKHGGSFLRGQAWALEGLIETYCITYNEVIFNVVEQVSEMLIRSQLKNGGWSSNLERWYMGEDGKGIPIVANMLMRWYKYSNNKEKLLDTVDRAIDWTKRHTVTKGAGVGLIFSYSFEGAISHSFYSKTAMYYSTAYAIELVNMRRIVYGNQNSNKGVSYTC